MNARYNLRAGLLALAVLICLPFAGSGAARAAEVHTGAWGLISTMGSQNPLNNAIWLATGDPADPFVHNNLIYVDMDMQYNYPSYQVWESATWRPASKYPAPQRFPASLLGTDFGSPIEGRYIQLRNLTLERADLDAQNVQFRFSPLPPVLGTTTSLTLNNGWLKALDPPGFYDGANFTLTASGDSTLSNWGKGRVSSQTTLNVTPGGKLTLFRVAFNHSTNAVDSWYFDNLLANVATIDGGTLKLDQSYVTFGRPIGGTHGVMTFQNNALLELTGEAAQLDSGYFNFNNSALNVGATTRLTARAELNLDTAAVTVGSAGDIHTEVLTAKGTSTLALPTELDARFKSVTTGVLRIEPNPTLTPNATLSLNGNGTLAVTSNLLFDPPVVAAGQSYGRIDVNDDAHLLNLGGFFDIRPGDIININRTDDAKFGLMSVTNGGSIEYRGSAPPGTNHVTNEGEIAASNDGAFYVTGHATLLGSSQGRLDIEDDGTLDIGSAATTRAENSLTTDNEVYLGNFSTLVLTLDPNAQKNDKLNVGPTIPSSSILYIEQFADLRLVVVNDSKLTAGAKFRLINYASLGAGSPFNGYPNNHIFSLGLNAYQINYADTADAGYAYANAITLTVVDNPALSPAVQQVAGVAGVALTTSALTHLNFEPLCVLTYTSPSLPAGGLLLNSSTGVISGTPTSAQAAANIIITGTGTDTCSSQSATATVTLNVAATQTITFAAPPTPTFAPNGTFVVSATATSGGVVVYSSLSPVCTTNGGSTITMLGAGTCTIAANQPGNANYAPAPQVTQNITIAPGTQAALVLSASPPSIALTGTSLQTTSLLRTTGGNGGGLVTYHKVSGPCDLAGASVTGTGTGNCVFNATKAADANYAVSSTSNNVTVVVTQNPLTVSYPANPLTIGTPASLSPTVSGATGPVTYLLLFGPLPPGLTLNEVTGVISGTPTGPVGQYPVAIKVTDSVSTVVFIASLTLTVQAPVQPIPTLSEWGMLILASLMVLAAGWRSRRVGLR